MNGSRSGQTSGNQETIEQNETENTVTEATSFASKNNLFDNYPKTIHKDKQDKHIPGSKKYNPGKSTLSISLNEAQSLINRYSGKGQPISDNKERVDFGKVIGKYVDPCTGKSINTTIGIIHYSKTGTHIVPARPKEKKHE